MERLSLIIIMESCSMTENCVDNQCEIMKGMAKRI